jgi:hypothetical protein
LRKSENLLPHPLKGYLGSVTIEQDHVTASKVMILAKLPSQIEDVGFVEEHAHMDTCCLNQAKAPTMKHCLWSTFRRPNPAVCECIGFHAFGHEIIMR